MFLRASPKHLLNTSRDGNSIDVDPPFSRDPETELRLTQIYAGITKHVIEGERARKKIKLTAARLICKGC